MSYNPQLLNITLKWSEYLKTDIVINTVLGKVERCFTINRNINKKQRTIVSKKAIEELFLCQKDNQILEGTISLEQPKCQLIISEFMDKISHVSEYHLLGGGCVSSNEKRNSGVNLTPRMKDNTFNQKRLTEITHLDEICTTDDLLIELTKERSIDLDGEILPYFSNILKKEKIDSTSSKILLKVLMYSLEFLLLDTRITVLQSSSINQDTINKLKQYIKKLQQFLQTKMQIFPLHSHLHVLEWINLILKFDKKDKQFLASACSDSDCLIFSTKFENSQIATELQKQPQSSTDSDAGDLVDNYSILFSQKNQIFHLIAYRRIIQQNFAFCTGNLPNLMDQIMFAHHKSFNRFKSQMSFNARFYSFLTIRLILCSFKELSKAVDFSKNTSIYINTFLFSKQEGIISSCEEEFKLSQNQHSSNESISSFMTHHQSFRFIASDILKCTLQILNKYLPQSAYYQEQQKYLNDLIKLRQSLEKSSSVKTVLSESYINNSLASNLTKNNLKLN